MPPLMETGSKYYVFLEYSTKRHPNDFFTKILEDILDSFCGASYFGILMMSASGYQNPSLACFVVCVPWIPQIHLRWDTCWAIFSQRDSWASWADPHTNVYKHWWDSNPRSRMPLDSAQTAIPTPRFLCAYQIPDRRKWNLDLNYLLIISYNFVLHFRLERTEPKTSILVAALRGESPCVYFFHQRQSTQRHVKAAF